MHHTIPPRVEVGAVAECWAKTHVVALPEFVCGACETAAHSIDTAQGTAPTLRCIHVLDVHTAVAGCS